MLSLNFIRLNHQSHAIETEEKKIELTIFNKLLILNGKKYC